MPHSIMNLKQKFKTYRKKRQALIDKLKDIPCADCGNMFPPECMDFDHVRGEKLFAIGNGAVRHYSLARVIAEIAKCELVCANCHRIRTRRRHFAKL